MKNIPGTYVPHVITIETTEQAARELVQIGCDPAGVAIMSPKLNFKVIKIEKIRTKAANVLKQTFLAKGAECAVSRNTAKLGDEYTDVILAATLKQYKVAIAQMKAQPWGLPDLAKLLEGVLQATEAFPVRHYTWADRKISIEPGKTLVMGILNITPDSFSDGGRHKSLDDVLFHAEQMVKDGAHILDIGAESTRPYNGGKKISAEEELDRLLPVLEKLLNVSEVPVSVDTYKGIVARKALELGAHMINDVWGLQYDAEMALCVAEYNVPVIIMHNQDDSRYETDIVSEILRFLTESINKGIQRGISRDKIIIDPGIGFGKTSQQNLEVMMRLGELKALGCPVLLGTSRKRFIGETLNLPVDDRIEGTGATVALGIDRGAHIIRVHDVKEMARVATMADAIKRR